MLCVAAVLAGCAADEAAHAPQYNALATARVQEQSKPSTLPVGCGRAVLLAGHALPSMCKSRASVRPVHLEARASAPTPVIPHPSVPAPAAPAPTPAITLRGTLVP